MGIRSLVVCGLTTAVCVSQTAREMADLGFQVIVAEDACTELSDESHRGPSSHLLSPSVECGQLGRSWSCSPQPRPRPNQVLQQTAGHDSFLRPHSSPVPRGC